MAITTVTFNCEYNLLYLNNLSGNTINAIDYGTNKWDNGSIGNYWSNYTGVDIDDDGRGDTPYSWNGVLDNYPIWDDGNIAPLVTIILPSINNTAINSQPMINITSYDPQMAYLWYNISGQQEFLNSGTPELLNDTIWTSLQDGWFIIEIYANDTTANLNDTYTIRLFKDTSAPKITVNSPGNNSYANNPPTINLTYYDSNNDTLWYIFQGVNYTILNNSAQVLNAGDWGGLSDGVYYVYLYANDTFGHINDTLVLTLYKDTSAPMVTINSPINLSYSNTPPTINLTYFDPNNDTLWYDFAGTNYTLYNNTDQQLNPGVWGGLGQGAYTIYFYANDTFGYLNATLSLTLYKDTIAPLINITEPANLSSSLFSFNLTVIVYETNISYIWYNVTGNSTKIFISNNTQTPLDNYIWNNLPHGWFEISIYANDSMGNVNDTYTLSLFAQKDAGPPNVLKNVIDVGPIRDIVNVANVTIEFIIQEDTGLLTLSIRIDNGVWIPLDVSTRSYTFENVGLGDHTIEINATDLVGQSTAEGFPFTVAQEEPEPMIEILMFVLLIGGMGGAIAIAVIYFKKTGITIAREASA